MSGICFGLAAWHRSNWIKSGKQSDVLKIESKASLIDGWISAGAGAALMGTVLLKGTPLDFLLPIADSILVLILSLVIIGQPMSSMFKSLRELAGNAADPEITAIIQKTTTDCLAELPRELVDIVITKIGRVYTIVPYLKPNTSIGAEQVDELRDRLRSEYQAHLDHVCVEVLITAREVALRKDLNERKPNVAIGKRYSC
jgi:predicted Co/Zn/Cd cation transporter (cation efflux family)